MKLRITSLLLIITVICSIFSFATIGASAETEDEAYKDAIKVVLELNLVTLDDTSADSIIQRRDLAEIAVKILGTSNNVKAKDTVFKDVAKSDVKSGYIQAAYDLGIFNGYFDGNFHPFEAVSYNEALKVLVSIAGYKEYAERKGGYPYGYISVAKEIDITKGVAVQGNSVVSFGNLCKLIINALEAGVMEEVGISGTDVDYEISGGETLLSQGFEMKVVKGQLTADYLTELTGESNLETNEVKIDGKLYRINSPGIHSYLGKMLVCYVDENDTIITFYEPTNKNEEIVIFSKDIVNISSKEIKYKLDDGKSKAVNLYDNADFIYNGCAKVSWSYNDIPLTNCEIRMLDSDGDKKYDVIFVNRYVNLIVDRYVAEDEVIIFKNAPSGYENISISKDDKVKYEISDADGNIVNAEDIETMDILSVSKSIKGNVYIIKISKDKIEGSCTAKDSENIDIDEISYRVDPDIDENSKYGIIDFGKKGLFYLNYCGEVVAVEYDALLLRNYAYLLEICNDVGLRRETYIRVYDEDGEFRFYKLSEKLKINGSKQTDEAIYDDYNFYSAGTTMAQLITYEKNSEDVITEINSAKNASDFTEEERELNFTLSDNLSSVQYRAGNMHMFASRYLVMDNTVIFVIPDDIENEEEFHIIKRENLYSDRTYEKVKIYDVDSNNKTSAVVMGFSEMFFESTSPSIGVIAKIVHGYDAEGNDVVKLTVNAGATPTSLIVPEELYVAVPSSAIIDLDGEASGFISYQKNGVNYITPDKLKKGDVIQYINDPKGKVSSLRLAYRVGTNISKEVMGVGTPSKNNAYAIKYYTFAVVSKVLDNAVRISVPSADGSEIYERVFPFIKGTAFYKFDNSTKTLEPYSYYRMQKDDKVFIYSQSSNVKLVVVYEGGE